VAICGDPFPESWSIVVNPKNRTTAGSGNIRRLRGTKRLAELQPELPFDPKILLGYVGDGGTIIDYTSGQMVFNQGDPADAVFYIQTGKVKLSVVSNSGREAVLAIIGAGNFFGETCLAAQPLRLQAATAIGGATVIRVARQAMIRLLRHKPAFSEVFMMHLLSRNMRVEEDLVDQLFNSSEKRLARVLLLLAHFGQEGKTEPLIAKISQETLAEMIGTTRSRVSFFMNKFRRLGFIEYNGGLSVHSSLLSVVLLDAEPTKSGLQAPASKAASARSKK
jgi:CRP/FNR family transcriptional regulator, cyclic AMP receptor protein